MTDEICNHARRYRCNNRPHHSQQSSKLSVVRDLQRWDGRRRYKLRLHNISTVHGHRARARQLVSTEHAIPAATRTTPIPKALSVLSGSIATADELIPAAGDIRGGLRPTSRSCRSFCACPLYPQKQTFDVSEADHFSLTLALWPGARMHCLAQRSPLSLSAGRIYWLTN
jgi:hypothetical protein